MKKLISLMAVAGLYIWNTASVMAQEVAEEANAGGLSELHAVFKEKFVQGGVGWMTPILILLIIGLAIAIERIISLNLATINTEKLVKKVEDALQSGGIEAAKDVCRDTRGPVASIFYQGLLRYDEGVEQVEKSIVSYGGVQMAKLESGMIWLQLFIALAPSLGFLGTVVGMIQAFDDIAAAGDISPTIVASGMMVALLTTVFGLIVAMILQVFYNYLLNKINSLVNEMEDASISIMDVVVKYKAKK